MTDNELLLAISNMMDAKLDSKLEPIKNDIRDIKSEQVTMKNNIRNIKSDIDFMKSDLIKINITVENELRPNIQLLAENYVPAANRYEKAISRLEVMESDIDLLKKVVTDHSRKLEKIS